MRELDRCFIGLMTSNLAWDTRSKKSYLSGLVWLLQWKERPALGRKQAASCLSPSCKWIREAMIGAGALWRTTCAVRTMQRSRKIGWRVIHHQADSKYPTMVVWMPGSGAWYSGSS